MIHISNEKEAQAIREKVIKYFWPKTGQLPTKLPTATNVYDGQGNLPLELSGILSERVARAEKLDVLVDYGYHHYSYLVFPKNPASRGPDLR